MTLDYDIFLMIIIWVTWSWKIALVIKIVSFGRSYGEIGKWSSTSSVMFASGMISLNGVFYKGYNIALS
jgi:hypothetical protein